MVYWLVIASAGWPSCYRLYQSLINIDYVTCALIDYLQQSKKESGLRLLDCAASVALERYVQRLSPFGMERTSQKLQRWHRHHVCFSLYIGSV